MTDSGFDFEGQLKRVMEEIAAYKANLQPETWQEIKAALAMPESREQILLMIINEIANPTKGTGIKHT